MTWWVYFASTARAGEAETLAFATEHRVLYRPVHTEDGRSLIPNVRKMRPGDYILLVYRGPAPPRARVLGQIATAENPVPGAKAIDRIQGDLAIEMSKRGYPLLAGDTQEVIRLGKVEPCDLPLAGKYGGHNAIHRVKRADEDAVRGLVRRTSDSR